MATRRNRVVEGSCWTCRKSRIKCDLGLPSCIQCSRKSALCSYGDKPPVRWVGGAAFRRRPASRSSSEPSLSPIATSPSSIYPLEQNETILYFASAVLPRFQLSEELIHLDLETLVHDEPLKQTVIAVSQAHYALHSRVEIYDVALVRKQARHDAIEAFRRCLDQGVQSELSAQRLFMMNVLLCILDGMIEPSEEPNASTCHLKGGFAILNEWTTTPTRMLLQGGLDSHLLSVYATMDLVHALLSGDKPFFDSRTWKMFADVQTWFGKLPLDDGFLDLLVAFSDMAALGALVFDNMPLNSLRLIEKCLAPIETIFDRSFVQRRSSTDSSIPYRPWESFCSIYKICGYIYLNRALRQCAADDEIVLDAVRHGVEQLMDERLPGMMRHCVVFPLLVIGSHCTLAQDRKMILEIMSPSSSYLSFGNMQLMADYLRDVWKRDTTKETWWETFACVSQKAFLF